MPSRLFRLIPIAVAAAFCQDAPVFHSDVRLVTVPALVTDARGNAVLSLSREDFSVFDDGVRREITGLWHETDLPLTLAVVIDTSESQRDLAGSHRTAVAHFLEHAIRPGDRAFTVSVDAEVILRAEVTRGQFGLKQALLGPVGTPLGVPCGRYSNGRPVCGGTALWNGIYASAVRLKQFTGARALIVLTDGHDTGSTHTPANAAEAAQLADAAVYAIRYRDSDGTLNSPELASLTAATGGLLLPGGAEDTPELLLRVEADLRSRYILGFPASQSAAPGKPHEIRVETARPGLTVRARREYVIAP